MKTVFRCSKRALFGLLTVALPLALVAQEDDEEVYELSPFTVDEQQDVGYLATSTLAGTRLNTPLRDVGAAISVLTQELFEDTGATDAGTILSYATNAEVGGAQGNFAGSGEFFQRADTSAIRTNPQGNQRVRGLASAELTRNYFLTDIPFDSYNSARITMSRGPNSLLFGIGSPGGVINNGIQGATLGNDFGEVSVRFGEHSSHRETFDYNNRGCI
ncbi:MAG: TonB-dependent receptor plug domain-containing protein [Verrucomicrobia bacterium]|nr:TonB-dependent receptor plug domain-containing protein [Verrucomicrobiota bacterium]